MGATTITGSGAQVVNVTTGADDLDGITASGLGTVTMNLAATAAVDLTAVTASTISLGAFDHAAEDFTVATGSSLVIGTDQTGLDVFAATDNGTVTITTADDVAGAAVGTITLGAADLNDTNDFSAVALVASDAHLTATTFDVDDATVTVTGSRNVDLGTVTATSVDATGLSGTFDAAMTATLATLNGSTGVNTVSMNGATVMNLTTFDGNDLITVTVVNDGTIVNSGAGNDDITLTDAGANAFDLGAGNDTVDVAQDADIDSVIIFGDGTADVIEFDTTANVDLADNTNFAMYGVETVDVTATVGGVTISAAQFALDDTFAIAGNAAGDILEIEAAAGGSTITTSGVTLTGTATLTISGAAGADTINGGALGETINGGDGVDSIAAGAGNDTINIAAATDLEAGDIIDGGADTDTINYTVAAAADLSVATITNIETIDFNNASATLQQGTGATTIEGYLDGTADTFTVLKSSTNFEAAAEANAGAVDVAGEWFFLQETALADGAVTVFDEVLGEAVTMALDGTVGAGADDAAAVLAGSLIVTIA